MMCCYYPTTTVAIDDDEEFLKTINQHFGIHDCITYISPDSALQALLSQNSFKNMPSKLLKTTYSTEDINSFAEHYALLVNLRRLHEEIYSSNRFQDTSVIIVDYYMESMNGIEVCQKLSQHPAKKILLTGGADKEKLAIEAFNNGIIHRFINKLDINFPIQLKQAINILQEAYFKDLTYKLLPYLPAESTKLLQNSSYINFTRNLIHQLNAIEYYLLDTSGSILYLNAHGTPNWLIIKSKDELNDFAEIAKDSDGPEKIINSLSEHKKIPFFFSDADYQQSVSSWQKYLYNASPLPGISNKYFTLIEGDIRENINKELLVSYESHKNKMKSITISREFNEAEI